ncbi:MAG: hypothetical protein SLRJCFUN_002337 [Candidatus Fervidibacter sp.]
MSNCALHVTVGHGLIVVPGEMGRRGGTKEQVSGIVAAVDVHPALDQTNPSASGLVGEKEAEVAPLEQGAGGKYTSKPRR